MGAAIGLAWLASLMLILSFWPGIVTWDSARQYGQALSGHFDDWHPPLMEWIWRQFIPLLPGPGPMLLLALGLYAAALAFLACSSSRQGRRREAVFLSVTGLFPPSLMLLATVTKDSLMAGCLLAAFACLVRFRETGSGLARFTGIVLIVAAACLRFNAFLAGAPLLLLALPAQWSPQRAKGVALIAAAALLLAMPAANRLLKAERSGVDLSLIIFDLGGITAHGGGDVFPPLPVKNIVAVNRGCYDPERWDSYSWWVDPVCPIGFGPVRFAFAQAHIDPELFWIKAIISHPIAYAAHRLEHWNIAAQFLVRKSSEHWITAASVPNDWNFQVAPNAANRLVAAAVEAVNATPLGWPCWWLALLFALVMLGRALPRSEAMAALAVSGLLYELGYAPFSVAAELRYHCWPMMAGLIALVMFVARWRETAERPGLARLLLAGAPLALVTALGLGWRWL